MRDAKTFKLPINVGIHEPAEEGGKEAGKKVKNTLIWIDEHGELVQRYQKVHLFNVDVAGGPVLKESKYVPPSLRSTRKNKKTNKHSIDSCNV
jgi:predicted amidohydrolase